MLEIITIWLLVENTSISCWHQVKSYYIDLNVTQSVAIKHFFYSPFILFNAIIMTSFERLQGIFTITNRIRI